MWLNVTKNDMIRADINEENAGDRIKQKLRTKVTKPK